MSLLVFSSILSGTILVSFVPEQFLKPGPARYTVFNVLSQGLAVTLLFLILSLIVQRPVFSGIAILVFMTILVIISNAKYRTLREPMVFSDMSMFSQAFRHPRLYFPFLGLAPVVLAPLIIIGLIGLVLALEPALALTRQRFMITLLCIIIIFVALKRLVLTADLTLNPEQDNAQHGLLNSLLCYAFQANTAEHKQQIKQILQQSPFHTNCTQHIAAECQQPNITVVQSESFFDARRLHPAIRPSILEHFDQCKRSASLSGKLEVPAWGANTMRSEFSFLTGIPFCSMGLYRYYPYQYLKKMPLFSLASCLHQAGYYCVCIHPHPATFFGREGIFPQLGFDEFIDIEQFDSSGTFGPYISDQAVTEKILGVSKIISGKTGKPLFIFAITMENHGPLHLEKISNAEASEYIDESLDISAQNRNDLTVYLRHLKNADNMIRRLTHAYARDDNKTVLCFYGDHVPSMPKVYETLQYTDDSSDYFIWHSKKSHAPEIRDMKIESLARLLVPGKPLEETHNEPIKRIRN